MQNKITANLALFITALIWGLSFVAQRAGMEYIEPFTFNAVRCFLGGISLLPLIIWNKVFVPDKRSPGIRHQQHITLGRAGIACGFALFIAMSIQQYCMQYVSAGKGGFITALYIVFVPVITVLYGEKLSIKLIISIVLSVIGLYLLCYKSGCGFCIYDILILLSAFFYAVHILVVGYYSGKINPIKTSCLQFFVVGFLSSFLVFLTETPSLSAIYECRIPILYAGILTCGVAYTLQIYGQKYTLPVIASLIFSTESVFAVIGGAIILKEAMSLKEILGCVLVICAVLLANSKTTKKVI